jgi:hypothetical protein
MSMAKKKNYAWIDKELKFISESAGEKPTKKFQARTKRFTKQYEKQGWSDMDTWSIDARFAEWIVPRLRRFMELNNGYPGGSTGMTEKKWDKTLKEMLEGFEVIIREDYYDSSACKDQAKALRALKLFGEWAPHLWW